MELTAKEFELLLCEFCRQDLPPHFVVEHNTRDVGGESLNKRQIDTKISGRLGISEILICGEAKHWNEKVAGETIDGLVGKYFTGEIRANKVIIFSNQGFTEPAITRAKKLGIELLEPKEIGSPIKPVPHIVGMGYLQQMILQIVGSGPQYSEMSIDLNEYVIIKGTEEISFQQNVCRLVVNQLRRIANKNIYTDLSKIKVEDKNVLYELKYKKGYRYHASFEVEVNITWDYFYQFLPTGVLRHLNSNEIKLVNIQGDPFVILNKILLSETKGNYENKEDLIKNIIQINDGAIFSFCIVDPDRNKTDPQNALLIPV